MRLSSLSFGRGTHVMVKSQPSTDPAITVVPGYCWSMDGADHALGFAGWPYGGRGLYAMSVRVGKLRKWPFDWSWSDGKGYTGAPDRVYSDREIAKFASASTVDEVSDVEEALCGERRDPKAVTRDLVKSVRPGVLVDHDSTYTGNFEAIINVPVKMYLIASGEPVAGYGTDFSETILSRDAIARLVRRPSI